MNKKSLDIFHYIIDRYPPEKLGATKLYKILWFSDKRSYLETGQSITGEKYVKLKRGPAVKPGEEIIKQLIDDGKITEYKGNMRAFTSQSRPDIEALTKKEVEIIDTVGDAIVDGHTAQSIGKFSHDRVWKLAQHGEEMPIYATLFSEPGTVDEIDLEWARDPETIKKHPSYVSPD